ncbi:MAG: NUDIX hydrolase [Planctomycetes bacterium]|nr:NUDIX hydrolase [Planctomycetota bacterium]
MERRRFEFDELMYQGRVMEIHRVGVRMPDGSVVPRDWAHYNGAAVILPILGDGQAVLIRNFRFAVDENLYELPAGMVDKGESPLEAAGRELAEETGYRAGRIEKLGEFFCAPGTSDELMHIYLAEELAGGPQDLEDYEQITVHAFSQDKLKAMIMEGKIRDAKTIAGLALYWMRRDGAK